MLTKLVNGERVVLSIEEEDSIRAEWAAADAQAVIDAEKDPTDEEVKRDPFKQAVVQLLAQATGKTRQEIIDLIKAERDKII
jgi:hypothetical protein